MPERASGWVSAVQSLPLAGEGSEAKRRRERDRRRPPPQPAREELDPSACSTGPKRSTSSTRRPKACRAASCGGARCMTSRAPRGRSGSRPNGGGSRSSARLRDYYQVEDEAGRRYWIYREGLIGDGARRRARLVHPRAVRLMPEKIRLLAAEAGAQRGHAAAAGRRAPPYVELGVTTPFLLPARRVGRDRAALAALELGMDAIGIADRNTLAGVVRMHSACNGAGLKPLIGCRLDLTDAPSLLAYPIDRDGYGRLSRLLSLGKMRAEKGECDADAGRCRRSCRGHRLHRLARGRSRRLRSRAAAPARRHCRRCAMSRRAGSIAATTMRGSSGSTGSRRRTAARSSPPTTSIITRPTAARCRTSSPASARRRRSPRRAICSTPMPSGI